MNLRELDSFKLSDAVVFHDKLNPRLWKNEHLLPEVKQQLEIIAEDFLEELGISGLTVKDITVSGSNAAFSYTPHSDLDLHILVDMSKLTNDEVYLELFNAKKNLYNDSHDIKVHGVPVELYVQDSSKPVVSLGEYSIMQDKWLRIPVKRRSNFDQTATQSKYEKLVDVINDGLKSTDLEKIDNILKTIKRYRSAGLEKAGEFGPENLAYKAIRSQGLLDQLYDLKDQLHSKELSIEETMNYVQVPDVKVGMTVHHNFLPKGGTVVRIEDSNKAVVRALHDNRLYRFNLSSLNKPIHEGASGYIPSEKEKNDPRFKTALTVDVKPDTIKKNAKAFGFDISRAGIPPLLR